MSDDLRDKKVLVTAAAQGIGRASALAAAAAGALVLATDLDISPLDDVKDTPGLTVQKLDMLDNAAISSLAADHSDFDAIIGCAGVVHNGTILDATDTDWDFAFELNAKSAFKLIQAFLPSMLERGGGSIVTIASVAGSVLGVPNRFVYGASKAALIGLVKSVAADYITQGIRCNAICPGTIDSPSLRDRIASGGDYEKTRAAFVARQPMGRLGQPEEIADLAVYLASDKSKFMTGQTVCIDGGMTLI